MKLPQYVKIQCIFAIFSATCRNFCETKIRNRYKQADREHILD